MFKTAELRRAIQDDQLYQERRKKLRRKAFATKQAIPGVKPTRPLKRFAKKHGVSLKTVLRRVKQYKNRDKRTSIQISFHELFSCSADMLATKFGRSRRQILRLRQKFRDGQLGAPNGINAKRRDRRRRDRERQLADGMEKAIRLSESLNQAPIPHSTPLPQPAPTEQAAIAPRDTSVAQPNEAFVLDMAIAKFFTSLPIVVEYVRSGGTRDLLNHWQEHDVPVEDLVNRLLPDKQNMRAWILQFGENKTESEARIHLRKVAEHPTTIAWAIHAPDARHSVTHIHVLSTIELPVGEVLLRQLQAEVNGGGDSQQIKISGWHVLRYFDLNSLRKHSLAGVQYGPAAPREVKVLQSLTSLSIRLLATKVNVHGLLDLAELIVLRANAGLKGALPVSWVKQYNSMIDIVTNAASKAADPNSAHLREQLNHFRFSLRRLTGLVAELYAVPLPVPIVAKSLDSLHRADHTCMGIHKPPLGDVIEIANRSRWEGIGAYCADDERLYLDLADDEEFVTGSFFRALYRFKFADFTIGDHTPFSSAQKDFTPMVFAREIRDALFSRISD